MTNATAAQAMLFPTLLAAPVYMGATAVVVALYTTLRVELALATPVTELLAGMV